MECPRCGTKTDSWPCPECGFPVTRVATKTKAEKQKRTMASERICRHSLLQNYIIKEYSLFTV